MIYGAFNYGIIKVYNDYPVCLVYLSMLFCIEAECGSRKTGREIQEAGRLSVPVPFECLWRAAFGHRKPGAAQVLFGAGGVFRRGAGVLCPVLPQGFQACGQQYVHAHVHWLCDADAAVL